MTDVSANVREPLHVAIVDDEELARVRLKRLLANERDIDVVGEAASGEAAVDLIEREQPDVVLLDVQMPDCDGFDVIARLGSGFSGHVVFVTAFDEHAVRAFEVSAVDYLLKPVGPDRLREALVRARKRVEQKVVARRFAEVLAAVGRPWRDDASVSPGEEAGELSASDRTARTERFLVRTGNRSVLVKASDVDWFEAEANYVRLHVAAQRHLVRATMSSLEDSLDPSRFIRIHRGTIVNLDRVREIQPWFSGDHVVVLGDGTKLRMSRSYAPRLMSRLRAG